MDDTSASSAHGFVSAPSGTERERTMRCSPAVLLAVAIFALPSLVATPRAMAHGSAPAGTIAFEATVRGTPQIFTVAPDGTALTQVTQSTSPALWGVTWVPGTTALAYSASGTDDDVLYQVDAGGGEPAAISPACAATCLGDDFPTYTPSGSRIVFERALGPIANNNAAAVALFTMNADGSDLLQLTQANRPTSSEDHRPTWAPDGSRIAFERLNTTASPKGRGGDLRGARRRHRRPTSNTLRSRRERAPVVAGRDEDPLQQQRASSLRTRREHLLDPPRRKWAAAADALQRRNATGVRRQLVTRRRAHRLPPSRRQPRRRGHQPALHHEGRRPTASSTDASAARSEPGLSGVAPPRLTRRVAMDWRQTLEFVATVGR